MAKQLTAPGCVYTIVARVDTTIYSPDQKWILDVPAGQHDFIAETNETIIPGDAMMCRKTRRVGKDLVRVNLLGTGSGSLVDFITRAIEQIVGKGNVQVVYEDGKMTVALALDTTDAQIAAVENLLDRLLPKDVVEEISETPMGYIGLDFLESTSSGQQYINTGIRLQDGYTLSADFEPVSVVTHGSVFGARLVNPNRVDFMRYGNESYYRMTYVRNGGDGTISCDVAIGERYKLEVDALEQTFTFSEQVWENINFAVPSDVDLYVFCQNFPEGGNLANGDRAIFHDAIRMRRFEVRNGDGKRHTFIPALDSAGTPCMRDIVSGQNFYNANTAEGATPFTVGFDTTKKAAISISKLPITSGGKLTISLPAEAENTDTLVPAAIDIAKSRGWTIIEQRRTN